MTGFGVDHAEQGHAADFVLRIDLVAQQHRFGAGYKLVMGCLVDDLLPIFAGSDQ